VPIVRAEKSDLEHFEVPKGILRRVEIETEVPLSSVSTEIRRAFRDAAGKVAQWNR
jgi:hypothetical protein